MNCKECNGDMEEISSTFDMRKVDQGEDDDETVYECEDCGWRKVINN
jgi:uncharacterized protein with PIN domain